MYQFLLESLQWRVDTLLLISTWVGTAASMGFSEYVWVSFWLGWPGWRKVRWAVLTDFGNIGESSLQCSQPGLTLSQKNTIFILNILFAEQNAQLSHCGVQCWLSSYSLKRSTFPVHFWGERGGQGSRHNLCSSLFPSCLMKTGFWGTRVCELLFF